MIKKVRVTKYSCPNCHKKLGEQWGENGSRFGPKFARCHHCGYIYRTGQILFSDLTKEEIESINATAIKMYAYLIPIFLVSLCIAIMTGFELVGLIAFMSAVLLIWFSISEFNERTKTMKCVNKRDKELYELEKAESELIKNRSNHAKTINNKNDTSFSLSSENETPVRYGKLAISGDDVRLEVNRSEEKADDTCDDIEKLRREIDHVLAEQYQAATRGDTALAQQLFDKYISLLTKLEAAEKNKDDKGEKQ